MRLWPEEIARAYPLRPDLDPKRPWWRMAVGSGADSAIWERLADNHMLNPYLGHTHSRESWDAEHPLPHPGVRVGQVWAWPRVGTDRFNTKLLANDNDVASFEFDQECRLGPHQIKTRKPSVVFLVSDQACPWLAPWAPVEVL